MQTDAVCVIRNTAHVPFKTESLSELDGFRMLEFPVSCFKPPKTTWVYFSGTCVKTDAWLTRDATPGFIKYQVRKLQLWTRQR